MSSAVNKFEVIREENAENITINFRMPNTELVSYVFPRIWHLEVNQKSFLIELNRICMAL